MSALRKVLLWGALVFVLLAALGLWWFLRPSPAVDRLDLVGPETQGFVTFLAVPEDRALREVLDSLKKRSAAAGGDKQAEWIRSLGDTLSGAAIDHVRATGMIEALDEGGSEVAIVVSLGRMAKVVAKMWFGISGSEREVEVYHDARILLGREKQDLAMAFVGNNLILSRDPRAVRLLIDRLDRSASPAGLSQRMAEVLKDVDPMRELPGFGALVNDRESLASLWRMATGAPEGSGIELPGAFEGMGFRFGFGSADTIRGDGYAYFRDEEAAAGSIENLQTAIPKLFGHFGLKARPVIEQQGRRLRIEIDARGVQAALDRYFPKGRS